MTQSTITRGPNSLFRATPSRHRRGGSLFVVRMIIGTIGIAISSQALPVQAQFRDWINTTNTNAWYDQSTNWTPAGAPGSNHSALFRQSGTYQVWWDAGTAAATPSVGELVVNAGNVTFQNTDSSPRHQFTINALQGSTIGFDISGRLTVRGLHVRILGGGTVSTIDTTASLTLDGSHSAGTMLSVEGAAGLLVDAAQVNVLAGGVLNSTQTDFRRGTGTVSGVESKWNTANTLRLGSFVGPGASPSTLNVLDGGLLASGSGIVGDTTRATVNVNGSNSKWNNGGMLTVGKAHEGTINVTDGGQVTSGSMVLGQSSDGVGFVNVNGSNSSLTNSGNLIVGNSGNGTLAINDGGLVAVGGTTTIGSNGQVTLNGGRFEFNTTSLASFSRIGGTSGSLAGTFNNAGYTNVASFTEFQGHSLDITDVNLVNSGGLYGDAALGTSLTNTSSGEVETSVGDRMRFAGSGNNAGEINNFGGQIRFDQSMTNLSDGFVSGRGQFIANGGWNNNGVMAFSGGFADIVGDVYNSEGATIVTSGNGTTTFYDDFYQENAGTVRTSAGSSTVFFGEVSGAGSFVGEGTVFLEGDLRPGNSPGTMSFGGDLVLSSSASTMIELGGLGITDFDRLLIGGDLFLGDSSLEVALWDGFELGNDMQFLFADVEGDLFGQFDGLGEGSLVGNFGGTDLFITYNGFGGNAGVGLFTSAIPEPSALALLGIAGVLGLTSRRRRGHTLRVQE